MNIGPMLMITGLILNIIGFGLLLREWHLATRGHVWNRRYDVLADDNSVEFHTIIDRMRSINSSHAEQMEGMLHGLPEPLKIRVAGNRLKFLQIHKRSTWVRTGGTFIMIGFVLQTLGQLY